MAGMGEEQRLAELNDQVFGNPLILRKIIEHHVTSETVTDPEPACVHNITYSKCKVLLEETPCNKLDAERGNMLRKINSEWEKFAVEIFTDAGVHLNLIDNNETGLRLLQEETHVPFAMDILYFNQHITKTILELGRFSLIQMSLNYPGGPPMRQIPQLPESLPAIHNLTVLCPVKWNSKEYIWRLFVQDVLDKSLNLKEARVLNTDIDLKMNSRDLGIRVPEERYVVRIVPWKYPSSITHLMLEDVYLPPVGATALQNLASLRINFSRIDAELHDKFIALLVGCKGTLQELILTGPLLVSRIGILSFPLLQNLKTLITNQKVLLSDAEQGRGLEGKVPVLEHLALEWSINYNFEEEWFQGWIGHLQTQALESIRRFSWNISQDPLKRDQLLEKLPVFLPHLNKMLPNLARLEIRLPDLYLPGLSFVFGEMVQLTSLKIDVWNKQREIDSNLQTRFWESLLIGENVKQAGLNNLERLEMVSFGSLFEGHLLSLRAITAGLLTVSSLKKLILRRHFLICSEAAKIWKEYGFELIVIE